jgi:lysophospholipase L1-like esterase
MTKIDWENITNYIESVGTTDTIFPFAKPQSSVKITASGATDNIIYTIGTQSGTLIPGQSITVTGTISSMTLQSASGKQPFQVWAIEAGTEKEETDTSYQGQIDSLTTSLAQKAQQSDLNSTNSTVALKADKSYVDNTINNIGSGSPKGVYATLTALQTAYPTGTTGIYVITADNSWYYWDSSSSAWTKGGVYQASAIADNSLFGLMIYSANPINFDFVNKKINIYSLTALIFRKARYWMANGSNVDIDLSAIDVNAMNGLFYNKTSNAFTIIATGSIASVTDDHLLIATFRMSGNFVSCPSEYTVNGKTLLADNSVTTSKIVDNSVTANKLTDVSCMGITIGANYPNFDFISNKITFYTPTTLVFKGNRYWLANGSDVQIDISAGTTDLFGLFYNKTANTFKVLTTLDISNGLVSDVDILIAGFRKSNSLVFMPSGFSINGKPFGINNTSRFAGKIGNFLGDSQTYGLNPDGSQTQLSTNYPTIVGSILGLATVNNYGISGSTLGDLGDGSRAPMATRYTNMADNADLIFVMGGTNDVRYNLPLGTITDNTIYTFYGALNVLMDGLQTKYPTQTIVFATPIHFLNEGSLGNYRQAILDVAMNKGIVVLDLYTTSGFNPNNATNKTNLQPDGIHPNTPGQQKLGYRVAGFLNTL